MDTVTAQPGRSDNGTEDETVSDTHGARGHDQAQAAHVGTSGGQPSEFSVHRDLNMPHFKSCSDPDDTGRAWLKWKREFSCRLRYFRVVKPEDKYDALTIYGGDEICELLDTLVLEEPDFASSATNTGDYDLAIQKLDEYFDPLVNKDSARNKFDSMKQNQSESVSEYYVRLKTQARKCQFPDVNDTIRSKLLQTMKDRKLRREAMTKSYTLSQLLTQAANKEAIDRQARDIETTKPSKPTTVNAVHVKTQYSQRFAKPRRPKPESKPEQAKTPDVEKCPYCANDPHEGGRIQCPASGKTCKLCGKRGHFAVACLKPSSSRVASKTTAHRQPKDSRNRNSHKKDSRKAHAVQFNYDSDSSDSDQFAFSVTKGTNKNSSSVPVLINDVKGKVNVDSCASANIMDVSQFEKIQQRSKTKLALKSTTTRVYAYAQKEPISLVGEFETEIQSVVTKKTVQCTFLVSKVHTGVHPLLCLETSSQLGLIKIVNEVTNSKMDELKLKYKTVFTGLGCHKKITAKLIVDNSVEPVAHKRRKIPYHLERKAKVEEDRLQQLDVLEKVPDNTPTTWCSNPVIVPKPNSEKIRYCSDMRVPNQAIKRPVLDPLSVEDIKFKLNGASVFSVLDMNEGYHQLVLDPESRDLTTFHGVNGKMRYKRLNYGTISAQDIFDKAMDDTIQGLPGVLHIRDDFICFGENQTEHDNALELLLKRFEECGLTFNPKKCKLNVSEIEFFGFKFSKKGVQPATGRVEALKTMPAPKSASEVKSLLGMAQYSASFIPNFSDITAPLRALTKKSAKWHWTNHEQNAFVKLKNSLSNDSVLGYYETGAPTKLQVDAGPHGLGLILMQLKSDIWQPVFCASRSLSEVEQRYSQTEREALAIRWACERCYVYLIGANFVVETDHAPLLPMFNNPNSRPPMRIERWLTYLQQFSFKLVYKPGPQNGADYLSRHPLPETEKDILTSKNREDIICTLIRDTTPKAIKLSEIQAETAKDKTLQTLIPVILAGDYQKCKKGESISKYACVFHELSVINQIVLRDNRIVLPQCMWQQAVDICHEGHFGIVRTKQLLRSKIWFPGIDKMVEKTIDQCIPCQAVTNVKKREPLCMSETPKNPWSEVSADFCGPFPDGSMLLVVIDNYSKYPEVEIVNSTSAVSSLPALEKMFATHGVPNVIKSDNGPPFNGHAFANFCDETGVKHRRVTPLWPEANGLAETFMKPLKKTAQAAVVEGKCWKRAIFKFLGNYRSTIHPSTGFSPRYLCMNRAGKTKLPELQVPHQHYEEVVKNQNVANHKNKGYADSRRNAKQEKMKENDLVMVKQQRQNKMTSHFEPNPYKITQIKGSMITAKRVTDDKCITRNSSFFKKISFGENNVDVYDNVDDEVSVVDPDDHNDHDDIINPVPDSDVVPPIDPQVQEEDVIHNHSEAQDAQIREDSQSPENREVRSRFGRAYSKPSYLKDYET